MSLKNRRKDKEEMKKYDSYKDSGIEWIGEIPTYWDVKSFRHLFSFSRGLGITKSDLQDEGIPCINYGEIHSKYGFSVNPEIQKLKCVEERYLETADKSLLKRGDFIFADTSEDIIGSGNFTVLDSDLTTVAGYHTIITRQFYNNCYKYLAYFFDSIEYRSQIRRNVSGVKVFSITQEILKGTKIVLPTITEQTSIASFLDRKTSEIDDIIADKKRLLELYEEEKTAIINQAVTKGLDPNAPMKDSGIEWLGEIPDNWEVKKLRYITKITTGAKDTENREEDGEYPFYVRSPNIERISTYSFDGEGILTAGDGVGVCKVWHYVNGKFDFHQRVYLIYDFKEIIGKLLFYYMKLNFIHDVLRLSAKSTVDSLRRNMFLDFQVVCPKNEEEQIAIVHHIESECSKIDFKKARTEELIELLTEYRTALVSEAVTGKIKVTED